MDKIIVEGRSQKYGFDFCWASDDHFVGEQIAQDTYESYESDLFLNCLSADSVLVDVGANIGYYTLLASKKIIDGKIYCFEPNGQNFHLLELNIVKNGIRNAVLSKSAISNERGTKRLYLSKSNWGDHQLYSSSNRATENVEVDSIDNLDKAFIINPTVVKIDTQGLDYLVLKGMEQTIAKSHHLTVFTEFWIHGNNSAGIDSLDYFNTLHSLFDTVHFIDEHQRATYPVSFEFVENECSKYEFMNHVNFLCVKGSQPLHQAKID